MLTYRDEMLPLQGESVKDILLEACCRVRGGIVAFFSSYKYENSIWEQVKDVDFGRQVFREPQDSCGVDGVLESYAKAVRRLNSNGALLLSVVGEFLHGAVRSSTVMS